MKISKIETEMADVKKRAVAQMTAMLVLASSLCVAESEEIWNGLLSSLEQNGLISESRVEERRLTYNGLKQTSVTDEKHYADMVENENGKILRFAFSIENTSREEKLKQIAVCVAGIGFETNESYELAAQLYDSNEKSCEYSSGEKYRRRDTACGFLTAKGMFFELEESWMYVTVLQTMNDLR